MSGNNTISITAFLKDLVTGPLEKMGRRGKENFDKLSRGIANFQKDGKKLTFTIEQIDKEIKRLANNRIKLRIDSPDFKKVSKELDQLRAKKDRIENASNRMGGSGMGIFTKAGIYGAAIGAAYKTGQFFASSVAEYNKSAQVEAQLKAGLKSTGGISGKTVSGMSGQAENLQKTTLFDDETTKNAQAILLTFTKVRNEIFDQSIPLMQDLATRMGTDLSSAALQVGKALNDPIGGVTALRRMGVQLDDQQKKSIETFMKLGQQEKAQALILKELQTEFGGSARAAAKAGTGGLTILKNRFSDLKETIGEGLMPALGDVSSELGKVVSWAKQYTEVGLADKMRTERSNVEGLVAALRDQNLPAERRNELYQDLINIAPEFSKALKGEKIDYEELNKQLIIYNGQMEKKITLASLKDVANKRTQDYATTQNDIISRTSNIITNIENISTALEKNGSSYSKFFKNIADNISSGKTDIYYATADAIRVSQKLIDESNDHGKNANLKLVYNYKENLRAALYGSSIAMPWNTNEAKSLPGLFNQLNDQNKSKNDYQKLYDRTYSAMGFKVDSGKPGTGGTGGSGDNLSEEFKNINGDVSKVKNINITIHRLGGDITYSNTTVKESASDIKDIISELLLTAVNDANLAGGE